MTKIREARDIGGAVQARAGADVCTALLAAVEPGPIPGDPDSYPEGVLNVSTF